LSTPQNSWESAGQDFLQLKKQGVLVGGISGTGAGYGGLAGAGTFVSAEAVSIASGSSSGTLAHTPNGNFLIFARNGVIQIPGTNFTISGAGISLVVPAQPGDVYLAWYTH
jgi:hypothetical protein